MGTAEIMQLALDLTGLFEVPADSAVHVPSEQVRRALVGIDLGGSGPLWAKQEGLDLVITHHPPGGPAVLNFWQVLLRQAELVGVPEDVAQLPSDATVGDLAAHLKAGFEEFRDALTEIEVVVGNSRHLLGQVAVIHGAGTNGGYPVAKALFDHGVNTVVYTISGPMKPTAWPRNTEGGARTSW